MQIICLTDDLMDSKRTSLSLAAVLSFVSLINDGNMGSQIIDDRSRFHELVILLKFLENCFSSVCICGDPGKHHTISLLMLKKIH